MVSHQIRIINVFLLLAVLFSFAFLSACTSKSDAPDLNEILVANKTSAKDASDRIGRVLTAAYKLPPLKEPAPLAQKLDHEPFLPKQPGAMTFEVNPAFNFIVLEEQALPAWVPKPEQAMPNDLGALSGMFPTDIAHSLELALLGRYNGRPPLADNPIFDNGVKTALAALPQLRYVLVIHPNRITQPQRTATESFTPGAFEGEARLFDLKDESYLGGFVVSAKTDDTVLVNAGRYDSTDLKYNLITKVKEALLKELSARGLK